MEFYVAHGHYLHHSTEAYVRLNRTNTTDVKDVITFIKEKIPAKTEGALSTLGYDKIVPSLKDQDEIITLCWDEGADRHRGFTDPRYGLAAACAGWKSEKTIPFLKHCLESDDVPLKYVAENSLKGRYVRLR